MRVGEPQDEIQSCLSCWDTGALGHVVEFVIDQVSHQPAFRAVAGDA